MEQVCITIIFFLLVLNYKNFTFYFFYKNYYLLQNLNNI